ncbi:unnamed protein product, partial [Heterotrigona itama]
IDLTIWTDLPKEIDEDFVSYKGDYDFPHYLSEDKEWVHLQNREDRIQIFEPFLITELSRFVPYIENNRVQFHALNMPNIIIRKIEIVGFVLSVSEDAQFYHYQVDDGTGNITIYHKKHFEINAQQQGKEIDIKDNELGNDTNIESSQVGEQSKCLPDQSSNLKHKWSTNSGTVGRKIKRCNYVHATGYCALDFMIKRKSREKITFEDLLNAKLNFLANNVTCISEHEYNKKLILWSNKIVRRRYDKNLNESEMKHS